MSHIHVCLISDQTIPNILSINHFKPARLLFITTPEMKRKKKSQHILDALLRNGNDYTKAYDECVVHEDSVLDSKRCLNKWVTGKEGEQFTVNLTCGTKLMAIAVYEFFKDFASKMLYIPIGHNAFNTIFPLSADEGMTPFALRLAVPEYLAAYGLRLSTSTRAAQNQESALARRETTAWIVKNYEKLKPLLERLNGLLRKHRNDVYGYSCKTAYIPKSREESALLERLGFTASGSDYSMQLSKSEIEYITGGWLEEFCYIELLAFKGRGIDDVVLGIQPVGPQGRRNEYDVMFTRNNVLYTVECKSLDQNDDRKTDALYKIAALQRDFGLRVESFFVSTSPHILKEDGSVRESIKARAEQFRTTIIPPREVLSFAGRVASKIGINAGGQDD